jgi:hypothetical protein
MMCWYRRWYSRDLYLHIMSATALALFMFFNVLSVLNVAALLGLTNWLVALKNAQGLPLILLTLLWCAHLAYALRRSSIATGQQFASTSRLAAWYMGSSFGVFLLSFIFLVLVKRPAL